jgi:hypothetical protein
MDAERRRRIVAAIERCGANLSDIGWFRFDDGTGTELTIHFSSSEPKNRAHARARAARLVGELRGCGMTASVEEYQARRRPAVGERQGSR